MNPEIMQILAFRESKRTGELIQKLAATNEFVHLLSVENSLSDLERKAAKLRPQIILVDYRSDNDELAAALEHMRAEFPRVTVVALSRSNEAEDILKAVRSGVREYLFIDQNLGEAFNQAMIRLKLPNQAEAARRAKVVGIMGAKGGVGASNIAVNLAWALSQVYAQRVALVDLDLYGGNGAFMLDVAPGKDWSDICRDFESLDTRLLDGYMPEVAPGMRLLAAPDDPSEAEIVTSEHTLAVLDQLGRNYEWVIMDLGDGLEEPVLAALEQAQRLVIALEPTLVGIKSAARLVALGERLGHENGKMKPVVNRSNAKRAIVAKDVEAALNREVYAWLPNDYLTIAEAGNTGCPALKHKPKSKWSKALLKMVERLREDLGGDNESA